MHIIVYRKHGELNAETRHYGPYNSFGDAYNALGLLPAIGRSPDMMVGFNGCKYIIELNTLDADAINAEQNEG